jgi:hypothetical protein
MKLKTLGLVSAIAVSASLSAPAYAQNAQNAQDTATTGTVENQQEDGRRTPRSRSPR